jgi:hypothetical protein
MMLKTQGCRKAALFLVFATTITAPAHSADKEGRYALEGPGRINCAAMSEIDISSDQMKLVAAWTLGYMSAHNRVTPDTFDLTPWQNIESVIGLSRQFCASNPEATYEAALQQLMRFLAPKRLQEADNMVRIGDGELQGVVYTSTLAAAREKLDAKGYGTPVDEAALALALKKFQTDSALPATGILDQATLLKLLG